MTDQHNNARAVPQGWKLVQTPITEEMHVAAVKVLHRAPGLAGLPQRMLDAMLAATPAPAPEQGPVDMVPRAALHEVERERDWYKTRSQTMHEHQNGQVWYWQGDGEDHPETLVNSLPVVIRADQLRELIAKPAQEVGLSKGQFDMICQAIDKADTVTMDGDYMLDSDDCIRVVRVMQVLFDIAALRAKGAV